MGISEDLSWLKNHIILLAIVIALTFGGVYSIESLVAKHDTERAAQYQALADQLAKSNQQFQQQTAQQIQTLVAQNQQLSQEVSSLATALSQRQKVEVSLPKQNANLSAQEAAKALGGTADGENVVLDLPIARNVVTEVQLVPLLQQDKVDLEKQNGLLQTQISNDEQALNLERKAHQSDNSANTATITARDKQISALKTECRKSKLKWFGIGYVAGFLSAIGLHASGV